MTQGPVVKLRKLTAKQQRFVQEYLLDLNGTQAAIRAGYSQKTAYSIANENLNKPEIAEAIQKARSKQAERTQIDADYVLNTIVDTVERCKQAKPVFDRKGEAVLTDKEDGSLAQAYVFDSKGVLKGCELLGRNLALWKDRVEHTGKDGGPIQTEEISDTERARRVAFLLSKATRETVQ
jgi:phage terminase small subunit